MNPMTIVGFNCQLTIEGVDTLAPLAMRLRVKRPGTGNEYCK